MGDLVNFIFWVGLGIVGLYFFLIRPQAKRVEAARVLIESVTLGDEVVTLDGVRGNVVALDDESIRLSVASGVNLRISRYAVNRNISNEQRTAKALDSEQPPSAYGIGDTVPWWQVLLYVVVGGFLWSLFFGDGCIPGVPGSLGGC